MDFRNLSNEQLELLDQVLRDNARLDIPELLDLVRKETSRRSELHIGGTEITKRFLLKYVKYDIRDGLGSYEVWRVGRIDTDDDLKQYTLYPESPMVSKIDGNYSIDSYLEEVIIETPSDLSRVTVIEKEEYDREFTNALEYYKNLRKDE